MSDELDTCYCFVGRCFATPKLSPIGALFPQQRHPPVPDHVDGEEVRVAFLSVALVSYKGGVVLNCVWGRVDVDARYLGHPTRACDERRKNAKKGY